MSILVVGSVAFDSIETPHGKVDHILGGAATHFALAASYFTDVRVIGVRFPVNPGYSAQITPDKVAALNNFLTSHGVSEIIDLRNALSDPRDFEDEDHLNDAGAVKVVKILEERLPLGGLLNAYQVPFSSRPRGFFQIEADPLLERLFHLVSPGQTFFGRSNELLGAEGQVLARIVEVLRP